jgi:hypothetical protein
MWQPRGGGLEGKTVLVLAETPSAETPNMPSSAVLEAEEAVISLVRAIMAEGGRVRLVADESLAMLASIVAGEYTEPFLDERGERPAPPLSVFITAGQADRESFAPLQRLGYANVAFHEDVQWSADALVCIGRGTPRDVTRFVEQSGANTPVFTVRASGGGASTISGHDLPHRFVRIRTIDTEIEFEWPLPGDGDEQTRERPLPPVTLAMQRLVQALMNDRDLRTGEATTTF